MRFVLIFGLLIVCNCAVGANMCVRNDGLLVALDPVLNGSVVSTNSSARTWSVKFSYGQISGVSSCCDDCPIAGSNIGSVSKTENVPLYPNGGERICFCKMLRPVESKWIYGAYYNRSCSPASCAQGCANAMATDYSVRAGVFQNVIE